MVAAPERALRRCASGTRPRAPPSARRARASSGRAPRSSSSAQTSRGRRESRDQRRERVAAGSALGRASAPPLRTHSRIARALQLARAFGARQLRLGPHDRRAGSSDDRRAARSPRARPRPGRRPGSSTSTACTRSSLPPRGAPTTAESRTPGSCVQHALDVLRKDVQPLGRDDHFLLAAADESWPSASISPMSPVWNQPSSNARARLLRRVEVAASSRSRRARGSRRPAAIFTSTPAIGFADRSALGAERVIQRDDRRGLGQAVALDDDEPEPAPERLELGIERRGADDERPELQAEQPMDPPVAPPAPATSASLRADGSRRLRRDAG